MGKILGRDFQLVSPNFHQSDVPKHSKSTKNHFKMPIFVFGGLKTPMLMDFGSAI